MATYNEIAYMIYDKLGLSSDDSRFNIDHIFFLMKSFRTVLLKKQYTDAKKSIPLSNYQTICINLETNVNCITGSVTKSIDKIPDTLNLNSNDNIFINPRGDLFNNLEWTFINDKRFSAIGNNKWLRNIVYFTLGTDKYLYLKSTNSNFQYLKTVELNALFEDPKEASLLECKESNIDNCNYEDSTYPLEETLVPYLIQLVYEELLKPMYSPTDTINNASDDLSNLSISK